MISIRLYNTDVVMMYTKSIDYVFIDSYQGIAIFLTDVDESPKEGSTVRLILKGIRRDCIFSQGILTFQSSKDAPQSDTKGLYLSYEV